MSKMFAMSVYPSPFPPLEMQLKMRGSKERCSITNCVRLEVVERRRFSHGARALNSASQSRSREHRVN